MLIELAERRIMPDALVRKGIRRMLRERLREEQEKLAGADRKQLLEDLFATGPIAVETAAANQQHYEVPPAFYEQMLGSHLKYSSCLWPEGCKSLDEAEQNMLAATCARAQIKDGQQILELGCGWGSLTLWMAKCFPAASIMAVSNSHSQREYIQRQALDRNLNNLEVRVCNVAELTLQQQFDRIVSVEMFEHMRNWQKLLTNVASWLRTGGKLFLHTFCHRELFYPFTVEGRADWMTKHFFSGGVMPSYDLLETIAIPLKVEQQWPVNGMHYAKTCQAWLENLDRNAEQIRSMFAGQLGKSSAQRQLARWRMFVMACEELFAFHEGQQWYVSHALLHRR